MRRIYHPYTLWEDYKAGFYKNSSGVEKAAHIKNVVSMFNSPDETYKNMHRVIGEWVNSCEHNLTNPSMNRVAYIGQGACCVYAGVPSTVTMEAWSLLTNEVKEVANGIAADVLKIWEQKNIILCLSTD